MKAFPGVIKPRRDIPAGLMPHLRYPPVLFEAQRQILAQYHVTQAQEFYGGQNFWAVPNDPSGVAPNRSSQPPYYLTMTMPGQPQPEFSLSTSLTPRGRANMAGFMEVDSNPRSPGYGTIRVLQLPQDTTIRGPQQVQNDFESNAQVASALSLLRQRGSAGDPRQPDHPAGRGRPGVLRARLRVPGGHRQFRGLPHLAGHARVLQRPGRIRADAAEALAKAFGTSSAPARTGSSTPSSGQRGPGQRDRAEVPATGGVVLQRRPGDLRNDNLTAYGSDIAKMKAALDSARNAAQSSPAGPSPSRPAPPPAVPAPGPAAAG